MIEDDKSSFECTLNVDIEEFSVVEKLDLLNRVAWQYNQYFKVEIEKLMLIKDNNDVLEWEIGNLKDEIEMLADELDELRE